MMVSADRPGECNHLISHSRKRATGGDCDWISFKSTSRSIELAVLISKERGRHESLCRYGKHHSSVLSVEPAEETGEEFVIFVDFGGRVKLAHNFTRITCTCTVITVILAKQAAFSGTVSNEPFNHCQQTNG